MGLATEITNNVTGGLQEVGQNFCSQLSKLSTVISAQGVSQIVGVFEGLPTKLMDWIKSIEKHILLAGGDGDQTKRLAYHTISVIIPLVFRKFLYSNLFDFLLPSVPNSYFSLQSLFLQNCLILIYPSNTNTQSLVYLSW